MNRLRAASPEKLNKSGRGCLGVEKVFNNPDHLLELLAASSLNPLEGCGSQTPRLASFLSHSLTNLWCF